MSHAILLNHTTILLQAVEAGFFGGIILAVVAGIYYYFTKQ